MPEIDFGRPAAEAFYTITDPEQARLLSDPNGLRFFRPFLAQEKRVSEVAEALGVALDTLLYRVKIFLKAGLLRVSRLEARAGRPIKHYRSTFDAYIIPFALTPYATVEETLQLYFRGCADIVAPSLARTMQQTGREGRLLYRSLTDGEVWQSSSDDLASATRREAELGPVAEFMDDTLELTEAEAHELLGELYRVRQRFYERASQGARGSTKSYFFQFIIVAP